MSFIKKHYEKVLLGAVLLGLFAALLLLPIKIAADKAATQATKENIIHTPPKPLPPLDMSLENGSLSRVQSAYGLDFETTNRLFNPMKWQKTSDGHWFPIKYGNEVGPEAVQVAKIIPLYFVLRLDSVEAANQFSAARYVVSIERQDAPIAPQRRPRKHYLSVGDKDADLSLISATGPADNQQLLLQVIATGEQVTVSKTKSFQEVIGYAADLKYPPQNKTWYDQRVGAMINLSGADYKVVVIDQNEVVISAQANQKKTTLQYQP
ncbi:MAG TPA: hypothetical protein VGY98_06320 [Verrucomicrobiae bacterium]|jgi:hypothetical protein|nr:hypothetical protein [Verrucomicrobiae bacterium]